MDHPVCACASQPDAGTRCSFCIIPKSFLQCVPRNEGWPFGRLDSGFWTWLIQSLQWQTLDHFWAFSMPISQAGSHYTASQILSRLLGFSFLQRKHFFALTSSLFTVNFLKRRGNIFNGHSKFYYFSISLYQRTQQVWPSILISLMEMG